MDRFPHPASHELSAEQKKMVEKYQSGWLGTLPSDAGLPGPNVALIYSPELEARTSHLGNYLRSETSLPRRLIELTIIIVGRLLTCQYEWHVHRAWAEEAGLDPAVADAIADGKRPENMQDDEAAVYDLITSSFRDADVADEVFEAALRQFSRCQIVEIVALSGYYSTVSRLINLARVPIPGGGPPPLRKLG